MFKHHGFFQRRTGSRLAVGFILVVFYFFVMREMLKIKTLDIDELTQWLYLRGDWAQFFKSLSVDVQGPFFYSMLRLINEIFPLDNDYWLRIPGLIIACGALGLWYHYWQKNYFDQSALMSLLIGLFIFNPLLQHISAYSRYSILFFTLISYLTIRLTTQLKLKNDSFIELTTVDVVCISILLLTHHFALFYFIGLGMSFLFLRIRPRLVRKYFQLKLALILGTLVILSVFLFLQKNSLPLVRWTRFFNQQPEELATGVLGFLPLVWLTLLLAMVLIRREKLSRSFKFFSLAAFFMILAMATVLLITNTNPFILRYLVMFVPIAFVLQEELCVWISNMGSVGQLLFSTGLVLISFSSISVFKQSVSNGPKQILVYLSQHQDAVRSNQVACVVEEPKFKGLLIEYSQQYFKRDVCSVYLPRSEITQLEKIKYVIAIQPMRESGDRVSVAANQKNWRLLQNTPDETWQLYEK